MIFNSPITLDAILLLISVLKSINFLTMSDVHSHDHIQKSDDIMHLSGFLTCVKNISQYMKSQDTGILVYWNSNSHADSRCHLYCISLVSPTQQLGKRTIGSFLHLLAALLKGGTVLAKVGHLGSTSLITCQAAACAYQIW